MDSDTTQKRTKNWQDKFAGFAQKVQKPAFVPSWVMQIPNPQSNDGVRKQSIPGSISEDSSTGTDYLDLNIGRDGYTPKPPSIGKLRRGLGMLRVDTLLEGPLTNQYSDLVDNQYFHSPITTDFQRPNYQPDGSLQTPSPMERLLVIENGASNFIDRRERGRARVEADRIKTLCEQGNDGIFRPSPLNISNISWMGNMPLESPISPHSSSSAYSPVFNKEPSHHTDRQNQQLQNIDINHFPIDSYHTKSFVRAPQYVDRDVLATIEPDYIRGRPSYRQAIHPAAPFHQQIPQFLDNSQNCAIIIENISPNTKHCDVFDLLHTGSVSSLKLKPPQPPKHMTMSAFVAFTNPTAARRLVEMSPLLQHNRKLWVRYNTTNGGTHAIPSVYITRVIVIQGPREMMSRPWWVQYFNNICNVQWDRYLNLRCDIQGYAALEFRFSRVEQARTCMTHVQNDPVFGNGVVKARFGRDPCDGPGFMGNHGSF